MTEDKEKKKTIIGSRIRVVVGNTPRFEDENDVVVLGEDTTVIVRPEEAKGKKIVGKKIDLQIGAKDFDSVFKQINEREDLDDKLKDELKNKVRELEKELEQKKVKKTKLKKFLGYFEKQAPWLMPLITEILKSISEK